MRHYARFFGEDEMLWALTGLLHDIDYEEHADEHPRPGVALLREAGCPDELCEAVLAHADPTVPRRTRLARALYAVDELTGFIVAVALVRPARRLADVDVRAVLKKWRDKAFARGVDREAVLRGAEELGVSLEQHVEHVLVALQENATALGLA